MNETKVGKPVSRTAMHLWLARFLAVLLIFGGVGGLVICMLNVESWAGQKWLDRFLAFALLALYLFSVLVGASLWKHRDYGKVCAAILFFSQVPIFYSKYMSYEWFTGISIKMMVSSGGLNLSAELGGSDNFHLLLELVEMQYGINLFAFCAAFYLLISYKFKKGRVRI